MAGERVPGQPSTTPEAIRKDSPKLTLEMPGPIGRSVRSEKALDQAQKDFAAARAKNPTDKQRGSFVVSKEDVRTQAKGKLTAEFTKARSGSLSMSFNQTSGKDRGR